MKTGRVGQIRTEADLYRAARRLRESGVTDPQELVDQLMRDRTGAEMRIMLAIIWRALSPAGRQRVLAEAFPTGRESLANRARTFRLIWRPPA